MNRYKIMTDPPQFPRRIALVQRMMHANLTELYNLRHHGDALTRHYALQELRERWRKDDEQKGS